MKKFLILFSLIPLITIGQSKKELAAELKYTKAKLDSLLTVYFQQQL